MTATPRPSATMCVIRRPIQDVEVLMVRRSPGNRFMPGAWVFPGGMVDAADQDPDLAELIAEPEDSSLLPWLAAGFRELVEETGVWLTDPPIPVGSDRLDVFGTARSSGVRFTAGRTAYFANWITPAMLPVRFDTRFFLVDIGREVMPTPDGEEIDAAEFVAADQMLRSAEAGERMVPFPTQRILEQLVSFDSARAAVAKWRTRDVAPVQPRIGVGDDGSLEVVLPEDPRFNSMPDAEPDPALLNSIGEDVETYRTRRGGAD